MENERVLQWVLVRIRHNRELVNTSKARDARAVHTFFCPDTGAKNCN